MEHDRPEVETGFCKFGEGTPFVLCKGYSKLKPHIKKIVLFGSVIIIVAIGIDWSLYYPK